MICKPGSILKTKNDYYALTWPLNSQRYNLKLYEKGSVLFVYDFISPHYFMKDSSGYAFMISLNDRSLKHIFFILV